jgi:tetratricopeptide (TPR) repeat protein
VKGINVALDQLISQINKDQKSRWKMEEPLSIYMFTAIGEVGRSTTEINGEFVFFQLLIDCLLRLNSNEIDKNELISCFEREYRDNNIELGRLREFQNDYSPEKVLWWYTRDSFFYKTLNTALRKQNIEMIILYRSYIADMHRQLQRYQSKVFLRVYRGQLISTSELDNLRQNTGQLVSVNSFLSTTTDPRIADMYMAGRAQQFAFQRALFVIDADPKLVKTKPFANISKYSNFDQESEILFMLGSIFRVISIDRDDDQVWIIRMSLCGDDEHSLKPVLERMKKENGTQKTNLCTLGKVLNTMGKVDLAKKYYNRCVTELSDNDPLLLTAYKGLADTASQQHDYEESMQWHQKLENAEEGKMSIFMYHHAFQRIPTLSNAAEKSQFFQRLSPQK